MIYPRLHSKWQTWDLKSTSPNLKQYTVPPPRFLLGRVNTWWSPHDQWVAKAYLQPGTNPQNPAQQPDCHLPSHTPCSLCSLKGLWEIITAHLHRGIGVPQKYHITWGPPPSSRCQLMKQYLNLCLQDPSKLVPTSDYIPVLQTIL